MYPPGQQFGFNLKNKSVIAMYMYRVQIQCCSVDSVSVLDLEQSNSNTKILSLAEHTSKVSTVNLAINLNHDDTSKDPLGKIKANIAQIQLLVPIPFVLRTLVSFSVTT